MSSPPVVHLLADPPLRKRIVSLLETLGYRYRVCETVRELTEREHDDGPDLAVGELAASGGEANELCLLLRQNPSTKNIPVLLIGAQIDAQTLLRALESGADEVLGGAYDDHALAEKIQGLLGGTRQPGARPGAGGATGSAGGGVAPDPRPIEAVERLAGVVAHDFNNMLMVIKGFNDVLSTSFDEDDKRRRFTAEMAKATDQAAELCRTLMRIAGREAGIIGPVDLYPLFEVLRPPLEELVGEGVRLHIECPRDVGTISADPDHLKQAISSICLNAMEAMPDGGELDVAVRRVGPRGSGDRDSSREAIVVELRDTGVGMSPEALIRAFEPYYTTKTAHKGLGLSIAYESVKQAGGNIECSSLVGVGTTFMLYFTIFDAEDATDARRNGPGSGR